MTPLEKEIESRLVRLVKRRGGLCLKWVCPGWLGVPDRICLMPGGRVFFVETKRPRGGKLSAMQKKWGEWLTRLGFSWYQAWNEEDLRRIRAKEQLQPEVWS